VGEGTTFRVVLPPAREPSASGPIPERAQTPPPRRRVLVVDDELPLLTAMRRQLSEDHDIDTASSAREALDRLRNGQRYDVILCDVMMPVMTGVELFGELRRRHPELADRLIFVTGGAFTPETRGALTTLGRPIIEKPFDPAALSALIASRASG
jgi:CheY-like chemotaxis protein